MKTALISDVHANLEALEAVLQAVDQRGADRILCLGDVVGYGGSPNECLNLIRKRCQLVLLGNHDSAASGVNYGGAAANNNCDPGGGVNCTPPQMAAHDKWVWSNQVAQQLPNGVGTVVYTPTVPPTFTIQVNWQDTGMGAVNYQATIRVPTL